MRPERRFSSRNGRGGENRPVEQPFWPKGVKSQGRRGRAPRNEAYAEIRNSLHGAVFKLSRRQIPQSRVQSFLIIDAFEKLADTGASLLEVSVFVAVDLLIFQRLHKGFA